MSTTMPYLNLRILPRRSDQDGYPTEARLDDGSFFGDGVFQPDWEALRQAAINARTYGQRLEDALFTGPIWEAYERALHRAGTTHEGRLRVRLAIDEDVEALHALRWERLFRRYRGQSVPLAASSLTPFSRYYDLPVPEAQTEPDLPFRILVAVANPNDLDRFQMPALDVAAELGHLLHALDEDLGNERYRFTVLPGRTGLPASLRDRLAAAGAEVIDGPTTLAAILRLLPERHALHLLSHARHAQGEPDSATLFLENREGSVALVRDVRLVEGMLGARLPWLVLLGACVSAGDATGKVNPFVGLGPRLVRAGVSAVIAMQDLVGMDTVREMSGDFYRELFRCGAVDQALCEARRLLYMQDFLDWDVPVLFMRLHNGQLLPEEGDQTAGQAETSGKYNIHIEHAQGVVTGEGNIVTQYFGDD